MSLYEHVIIARQDISGAQVDSIVDAMATVISEGGGEVKKREYWGLRNLTYRINKNRKGHYVLLNIDAPGPTVHEMERQERLHEDILRYLTIRVDELEEEPSIVMKHRGSRDDGDRDRGPRGRGRDDDRRPPREARDADKPAAEATPAAEAAPAPEGGDAETKSEGDAE